MSNEVVIKSGHYLAMGETKLEIRDAGEPIHYVDVLTEARQHLGVIYLAFGGVVWDANNDQIVQIASRLRMNLGTAQDLHRLLGQMINDATKPIDKTLTN
jgi:hypothetical protein